MCHLLAWNRSVTRDEIQPDLKDLYALSRVNDILISGFIIPQRCDPPNPYHWPEWPTVTVEQYESFFRGLGFQTHRPERFHPIFHEIVRVTQTTDPDSPPRILEFRWPAVMLGQMVFSRAGVHIAAGENHVVAAIAETSALYFTYTRPNRQTDDLSHGSGSSSQWDTDLRRDYVDDDGYHYNVDGEVDLADPAAYRAWQEEDPSYRLDACPGEHWFELLTHRCDITGRFADDEWPYHFRLSLPRDCSDG